MERKDVSITITVEDLYQFVIKELEAFYPPFVTSHHHYGFRKRLQLFLLEQKTISDETIAHILKLESRSLTDIQMRKKNKGVTQ